MRTDFVFEVDPGVRYRCRWQEGAWKLYRQGKGGRWEYVRDEPLTHAREWERHAVESPTREVARV